MKPTNAQILEVMMISMSMDYFRDEARFGMVIDPAIEELNEDIYQFIKKFEPASNEEIMQAVVDNYKNFHAKYCKGE